MQKTLNSLLFLVEVSNYWLGIVKGAGCEDIDVVVIAHAGQKLEAVGSHIELELVSLAGKPNICLIIGED